jgi:hypothetical protein
VRDGSRTIPGGRNQVLGAGGRAYIPYGITVPGLANAAFRNYTALDDAKIRATAADWCANTVRLQVGQANLVGTTGSSYSAVFWKDLVGAYGRDPQVVLDVFNEPRVETGGTCGTARDWQFWQEGGTYRGTPYLGMQTLVTDVRRDGAANLLWVEGPCGMTGYQLAEGLLIRSASLNDPTRISTSGTKKWRCANGLDEGAGNQILNWYRQQNEN